MKLLLSAGVLTGEIKKIIDQRLLEHEVVGVVESPYVLLETLTDYKDYDAIYLFSSGIKDGDTIESTKKLLARQDLQHVQIGIICFEKDVEIIELFEPLVRTRTLAKTAFHIIPALDLKSIESCLRVKEVVEKKSFFSKVFQKKEKASQDHQGSTEDDESASPQTHVNHMEKGVYIATGHESVGKSHFISNMAYVLSTQKIRTVVVDIDVISRGLNLYFNQMTKHTMERENAKKSFVKGLENPEMVDEHVTRINGYLDIIGTAYGVALNEEEMKLSRDVERLGQLLTYLRNKYDVVLLDMPIDWYVTHCSLTLYVDQYILLLNNTAHSIYKTSATLANIFTQYPDCYDQYKYKHNLVWYQYKPSIKLDGVKLNQKKSQSMFEHLMGVNHLHFKQTTNIKYIEGVDHVLYSDKAISVNDKETFSHYFEQGIRLFKKY